MCHSVVPGDLGQQAGIGQRVIEIPGLPVERIRVGVGALELADQVGVIIARTRGVIRTGFDRVDRIFLSVGVQVAHDQEVRVAAAGRVGGEPVYQRLCGQRTRASCSCLSRQSASGSPTSLQEEPLDLR